VHYLKVLLGVPWRGGLPKNWTHATRTLWPCGFAMDGFADEERVALPNLNRGVEKFYYFDIKLKRRLFLQCA